MSKTEIKEIQIRERLKSDDGVYSQSYDMYDDLNDCMIGEMSFNLHDAYAVSMTFENMVLCVRFHKED